MSSRADVVLTPIDWLPTFGLELIDTLRMRPSDLPSVRRSTAQTLDARYKPLAVALAAAHPGQSVRVYGKGGRAYGFAVENAYIVSETTGRSFFLAATIHANDNDTFNDDRYEYDAIADPFLSRLAIVLSEKLLAWTPSNDAPDREREHP